MNNFLYEFFQFLFFKVKINSKYKQANTQKKVNFYETERKKEL